MWDTCRVTFLKVDKFIAPHLMSSITAVALYVSDVESGKLIVTGQIENRRSMRGEHVNQGNDNTFWSIGLD